MEILKYFVIALIGSELLVLAGRLLLPRLLGRSADYYGAPGISEETVPVTESKHDKKPDKKSEKKSEAAQEEKQEKQTKTKEIKEAKEENKVKEDNKKDIPAPSKPKPMPKFTEPEPAAVPEPEPEPAPVPAPAPAKAPKTTGLEPEKPVEKAADKPVTTGLEPEKPVTKGIEPAASVPAEPETPKKRVLMYGYELIEDEVENEYYVEEPAEEPAEKEISEDMLDIRKQLERRYTQQLEAIDSGTKDTDEPAPENRQRIYRGRKPSMKMRKDELISIANDRCIELPENATKRIILDLIDQDWERHKREDK